MYIPFHLLKNILIKREVDYKTRLYAIKTDGDGWFSMCSQIYQFFLFGFRL